MTIVEWYDKIYGNRPMRRFMVIGYPLENSYRNDDAADKP